MRDQPIDLWGLINFNQTKERKIFHKNHIIIKTEDQEQRYISKSSTRKKSLNVLFIPLLNMHVIYPCYILSKDIYIKYIFIYIKNYIKIMITVELKLLIVIINTIFCIRVYLVRYQDCLFDPCLHYLFLFSTIVHPYLLGMTSLNNTQHLNFFLIYTIIFIF